MTPIGKDITKCNEIACNSLSYTLFVFMPSCLLCFYYALIYPIFATFM